MTLINCWNFSLLIWFWFLCRFFVFIRNPIWWVSFWCRRIKCIYFQINIQASDNIYLVFGYSHDHSMVKTLKSSITARDPVTWGCETETELDFCVWIMLNLKILKFPWNRFLLNGVSYNQMMLNIFQFQWMNDSINRVLSERFTLDIDSEEYFRIHQFWWNF